jgi:FtsP/CotA-like multicopper oxidase with cupredoxin domain
MTLDARTGSDMDARRETGGGSERAAGRGRLLRRLAVLPLVGLVALVSTVPLPHAANAADPNPDGLAPVCKTGGGNGDAHYVLTAHDGYILTPDGNSVYMWSYSNGSDAFQYPGPALCVSEGDTVTITLQN